MPRVVQSQAAARGFTNGRPWIGAIPAKRPVRQLREIIKVFGEAFFQKASKDVAFLKKGDTQKLLLTLFSIFQKMCGSEGVSVFPSGFILVYLICGYELNYRAYEIFLFFD